MKIVSPLLRRLVYPTLSMAGVFHRTSASGLAVVTYHGVMPRGYEADNAAFDGNLISAEVLRRQLRLLKAHYNVISPEEVLGWRQKGTKLPARAALVTCDDGLRNCLTDMLPVLQEEAVRCLFFVTGDSAEESRSMLWYEDLLLLFLGASGGPLDISAEGIVIQDELGSREQRRAVWWNSVMRLSQLDSASRASFLRALRIHFGFDPRRELDNENSAACRRYGMLNCYELQRLRSAGMTIGAHTLSHPILSQMRSDLAYAEISKSRMRLESVLQQQVWAFAYPFGDPQSVTPQVLAMPQKAGYEAAFMNYGGGLGSDLPPYALPRVHVTAEMSLAEFEAHVCGFYTRLKQGVGRNPESIEVTQTLAQQ